MKQNILNDAKKEAEILPTEAMKVAALLPIQAMKLLALLTIQSMKLPALPTPPPQDQMTFMSMALIYLLSSPLVFVYFLHIVLFSLKKISMKNRINHQNNFICFRSYIINE